MKVNLIYIIVLFFSLTCAESDKQGERSHQQDQDNELHDDKAIIKSDKNKGIQLAHHVIKELKIRTTSLQKYAVAKNIFKIPKKSLVYFKDDVGIYYQRNSWYNLQHVSIKNIEKEIVTIVVRGLKTTDKLVIDGVSILRLAHLETFVAHGEGHGH